MSSGARAFVRPWRPEGTSRSLAAVIVRSVLLLAGCAATSGGVDAAAALQIAQVADSTFRHDLHADFQCRDCHAMQPDHGALLITNVLDCRGCHHVPERSERPCIACHEADELRDVVYLQDRILSLSVFAAPANRRHRFSHEPHQGRACVECHTGGPTLEVPDLDCRSCHEEHHTETGSGCLSCHGEPPEGAHPLAVHQTCSGAGCHVDPPFDAPPPTRTGCLWCHQDRVDHEAGIPCVDCHLLVGPAALPSTPVRSGPG